MVLEIASITIFIGLLLLLMYILESGGGGEDPDRETAESQVESTAARASDISERAQNASSPDQAPKISEIQGTIKSMRAPARAFQLLIQNSDKELKEVIDDAKKIEKLKEQEAERLREVLDNLKDVEYRLDQLTGAETVVEGQTESVKSGLMREVEEVEEIVEDIEEKQSRYRGLLNEEEREALKNLKSNRRAVKDIRRCVEALSKIEEAERNVSSLVRQASDHHDLEISEEQIASIEKSLEKALKTERSIEEEISELEALENETEEVTEKEVEEIKEMLTEDKRIEQKLEKARKDRGDFHDYFSQEEFKEVMSVLERLKDILEKLGSEIENEDEEEQNVEKKVEEEHEKTSREAKEAREELSAEEDVTQNQIQSETEQENISPEQKYDTPLVASVSDIHGQYSAFMNLLDQLDEDPELPAFKPENYILVINGDAFDDRDGREGASYKVFNKIRELSNSFDVRYIFGNHDEFILFKELVPDWREQKYDDPFWARISEEDRLWFINQIISDRGMVLGQYQPFNFTYVHAAPTDGINQALSEAAAEVKEAIGRGDISRLQDIRNGYSGLFSSSNAAFWTRWDDLVDSNLRGRYIVGHTMKSDCKEGLSFFGDGSNPRYSSDKMLVNENTIRDGDPAIMVETSDDLCALRYDGKKKWLSEI